MKLSELIIKLQQTLDTQGDTEHVALCHCIGGFRRDAWGCRDSGEIEVLHDTAQYPNGVTYLVADYDGYSGDAVGGTAS